MRNRLMAVVLTAALLWPAVTAAAQGRPPEEIGKAQALIQAKDYDGAVTILEGYLQRTPAAGQGWLLLATAYRQKGELDKAIAANMKVVQPRPLRLQGIFNAAGLYALKGNGEEAFKLLRQLRDSGNFDMDLVRASADLQGLEKDPRYATLFPKPEEFADPFVEKVKILHEWVGESKGDQFSWIARGIGDVDGDRVADVVTSAPTYGAKGQAAGPGRVYVYSGKTGRLIWAQTGGSATESLGIGLEGAGDVNADGVADVIAGAPGVNKAYVFSGKDGKLLLTVGPAEGGNEGFGSSASGVGDQNGDGHADVMVGAPGRGGAGQGPGQGVGRAYLFSGKDGSPLRALDGEKAGDRFGSIVAGRVAGRKDKRNAFLLVGAPGAGPNNRGRVYVYAGLADKPKFIIEADETGVALGAMFTSVVGDVNRDGVPDIFASDFANAAKGPSTGKVYVHSGADGRRLHTFTGEAAGDGFGIGSPDVGDVNKDGYDDLLLGAWQHASVASSGGKVYLYSGKDGSLLRTITCRVAGETLGFDATGVGDVNGDGVIDFLLTSTWSHIRGFRSGRMFIISGREETK